MINHGISEDLRCRQFIIVTHNTGKMSIEWQRAPLPFYGNLEYIIFHAK